MVSVDLTIPGLLGQPAAALATELTPTTLTLTAFGMAVWSCVLRGEIDPQAAASEVLPSAIYTGELLRHALRRPALHAASQKQPRVSAQPIVPTSDRGEVRLPSDVPTLTPPVASNLPAPADEART